MRKFVNFRAAAFAATGLVAGILFSYCLLCGSVAGLVAVCVFGVIVAVLSVFFSSAKFTGIGKFLCLLFFALCAVFGGVRFKTIANNYKYADLGGHILAVSGNASEITVKENVTSVIVSGVKVTGAINGRIHYKIYLSVYGENDLRLGDKIAFTSALTDLTLFYNGKFAASALEQGIKYSAEINADELNITENSPNLFEKGNLFIFDTLKTGLHEDEFPIAYAMLTGNSDYITEENLANYRAAGVAHIFAVSGLHIGFLATALYFILNKLKINSFVSFAVTLACCVFYAGVCGFSASSLRAVVMFVFLNLSRLFGLKYDGISSACAAAFIILAVSPAQLFCVGFQLSFAVVLSVIILFVPLKKLLKFLPDKIAAPLAVSFAAEIGGVPVLLYAFGEFASLSLFVNLLFIPIAGIVYIALIIFTVLGGIFSPTVFLFLPEYMLFGLNFIINAVDFKVFLIGGFTFGTFAAAYYGVIFTAGGIFNLGRIIKPVVCVTLAVVCIAGTWATTSARNGKLCGTVIGSENLSAVLFTVKGENILVISDVSYKNFSLSRLKNAAERTDGEDVAVVLLKQTKSMELLPLTIRLKTVLNVNALYYYGEKDADTELIFDKVFSDFTIVNMSDGDSFKRGGGEFTFLLGGKCMLCSVNGYNTAVFSSLADTEDCSGLTAFPQAAICYDKYNSVTQLYSPKVLVSFREKYGYQNGEKYGNLTMYFG